MTKEEQVLEILLEHYPRHIALKKHKIHLNEDGKGYTVAKIIKIHGFEEAKKVFSNYISKRKKVNTLEGFIERYGKEEGTARYKEKNSRLSVSEASLRNNGKTEEEIKIIREKHAKKSRRTKENFISSYGEEMGTALYNDYDSKRRIRSPRCIEYFLAKGYDKSEAIKKVSDFQRIDLDYWLSTGRDEASYKSMNKEKGKASRKEYYIEKYGEVDGEIEFQRAMLEKTKPFRKEYYIEKYGEVDGEIEFQKAMTRKTKSFITDSKPQINFATKLFESLPDEFKDHFIGAPITDSKIIPYNDNEYGFIFSIPDIVIEDVIIEFDGDYWHSLPDIKKRDEIKDILRTQMGYHTIRVNESSWNKDPDLIIKHIIDTLILKFQSGKTPNEDKDD